MDKALLKQCAIELEREFELCAPFNDSATNTLYHSLRSDIQMAKDGLVDEPMSRESMAYMVLEPVLPEERFRALMSAWASFEIVVSGQKLSSDKINKPVAKKYADILLKDFINHKEFAKFTRDPEFIELLHRISREEIDDAFLIGKMFEAFDDFPEHPYELFLALNSLVFVLAGSQNVT